MIVASLSIGNARLSLTVRKAKMDYKGIMEKPFFTLSVRARGGTLLEQSQDTPPGAFSRGIMISDQTLVLVTPISELPQGVCSPHAVSSLQQSHFNVKTALLTCALLCIHIAAHVRLPHLSISTPTGHLLVADYTTSVCCCVSHVLPMPSAHAQHQRRCIKDEW